MNAILILFGIAALTLFLAMGRQMSVLVSCLLVLLVGVTFGHPFFNLDLGPVPLTIDRLLWGWLVFASLLLWKLNRSDPKSLNRTDMAVIALAVVLVASTLMHDWRYKDNLPLSRLLFFNLMPVGFYFVAKHCRIRPNHLTVFYVVLAIFGLYLSLTAIAEQQGYYALVFPKYILDPQYWEFLGRARGPFLNPVSCGFFLAVCLVGSGFLWPRAQPLGKVFVAGLIGLCLLASFLTLTRSVWVGCAVAVGTILWFPAKPQVRGTLIVTAALLLVTVSVMFSDKLNHFQRDKNVTAEEMAQSASLRPMLAYVALKMFRDKPLFGHGFGQYTAAKKPYHYQDTGDMPLSKILPYMQHNVFLSYVTETGMLGLTLLLILLTSLTFKSWQLWQSPSLHLAERQFGLLGLVVVGNYFINGMFHDVSIIPHIGALFFLILGVSENLHCSRNRVVHEIPGDGEQLMPSRMAA